MYRWACRAACRAPAHDPGGWDVCRNILREQARTIVAVLPSGDRTIGFYCLRRHVAILCTSSDWRVGRHGASAYVHGALVSFKWPHRGPLTKRNLKYAKPEVRVVPTLKLSGKGFDLVLRLSTKCEIDPTVTFLEEDI